MTRRIFITLTICLVATSGMAQQTVQSIRERYNAVHEVMQQMTPDKDGETMLPKEYIDLDVYQNLPGTGGHNERIKDRGAQLLEMFKGLDKAVLL